MSDLVQRLRRNGGLDREEAADEIERLQAAIDDALGRFQVTHIHAALRAALGEADNDE